MLLKGRAEARLFPLVIASLTTLLGVHLLRASSCLRVFVVSLFLFLPTLAHADPASDKRILDGYHLTGAVEPFRDPSIIRQGDTWYVFGTDVTGHNFNSLPIRCSKDKVDWQDCGAVFKFVPKWMHKRMPGLAGLWAPDISYFHGEYHLYYAASIFGTNLSLIGLATNATLDQHDPRYQWVDRGEVLSTKPGDTYNAIDPNILVESEDEVWLSFGSFWSGLKQRRVDPATGMLSTTDTTTYAIAAQPTSPEHAIEASSLVHKGDFYYLFASVGFCCTRDPHDATYRIIVGRGSGPHGPFADRDGKPMLAGGGTELLAGSGDWLGPGGQTVYLDRERGDLITFHALHLPLGAGTVFVNPLRWDQGWPVIEP